MTQPNAHYQPSRDASNWPPVRPRIRWGEAWEVGSRAAIYERSVPCPRCGGEVNIAGPSIPGRVPADPNHAPPHRLCDHCGKAFAIRHTILVVPVELPKAAP